MIDRPTLCIILNEFCTQCSQNEAEAAAKLRDMIRTVDMLPVIADGGIKKWRAGRFSLRQFSAMCGVDVASLSRIENGKKQPRLATLVRILRAIERADSVGGVTCDDVNDP
jgi:hypothetical protein